MNPYRQGDILFVPVNLNMSATPRVYEKRERGQGLIVAQGEATGHHHRVRDRHARIFTPKGRAERYLTTSKHGASVTHEEHDTLALPPDTTFEIVHQREHVPAKRTAPARSNRVWD